jgi:eukaryotic-like serine/threonine-protein kinase
MGGALIGSPSYMAPERVNGEEPRPPVDLWSLGATLYAAVEGRPPFARGEAMATMMSVVSEHPAPMLRAGPLEPVLRGLLTKDPAARTTAGHARQQLSAVLSGAPAGPTPPPPPAASAPPPRGALPAEKVERIDADDLRKLASASKALLTSVARDARDQARQLADRRRERRGDSGSVGRPPVAAPRRRRFKRRWVVVPVLVTVAVVLLVLVGLGFLLAAALGLL